MRLYGSIQTKFWTHPDIQKTSDQAKLLAAYLLCSSHTNMLGCFRVPLGYIAEDLKWNVDVATKALNELAHTNYLTYDADHGWVFIHHFLKYNPIENPNQGRSIAKLFEETPKQLSFIPQLIEQLLEHDEFFREDFRNTLQTLSQPFRNQDQEQDQDQDQDQNQEQEIFMSGKPDVHSLDDEQIDFEDQQTTSPKRSNVSLKEQATEILQFLNNKSGRLYRPVDTNLKLIMARLKSGVTLAQCFQVIAKKTREWKGDPKMDEYLRPATLFNATKFEQYVGELVVKKSEEKCND